MIFNKKQQQIIHDALFHIKYGSEQIYEFGGLAGTGKSVTINAIIDQCGIPKHKIAPMSYIGQAAIVMRSKGLINARTIHSWLFTAELGILKDKDNNPIIDPYYNTPKIGVVFKPRDLSDIDLFVIDEAYTVPMNLKKEIESRGKKIIATGDPGQLPPVKDKPAYLTNPNVPVLDEIMRQDSNSSIIYLADRARRNLPLSCGFYGNVLIIEEDDLTDDLIVNSPIVICGKNKTRDYYNKRIRSLRGYKGSIPQYGEKIICRKNNWLLDMNGISLANGLIGTVASSPDPYKFDGKSFTLDFVPDMFPYIFNDLHCDYEYFIADADRKPMLKNNRYNDGEKFEFAYAITTHLSQGAEFPYGIYIEEYMGDIQKNLNYVGITRFSKGLIYVKKKPKKYF